jgi:ABC-type multidrug transport system ATPase subunit
MPVPALNIVGVSKHYSGVVALDDVSCRAHRREILGVIGPNGAGKTTLFGGIAGTLPLDSGRIECDGHAIPASARPAHIGYMPDGITPWEDEPVSWILRYVVDAFGGRDDITHLQSDLDLGPLATARLGRLSKGQRKRVLLAVALLLPQPILLIDEPFDGLDVRQTRHVGYVLRTAAESGRTLVLSIHQMLDAARLCDRVVLLSAGRVIGEGTVAELAARTGTPAHSPLALEEIVLALT